MKYLIAIIASFSAALSATAQSPRHTPSEDPQQIAAQANRLIQDGKQAAASGQCDAIKAKLAELFRINAFLFADFTGVAATPLSDAIKDLGAEQRKCFATQAARGRSDESRSASSSPGALGSNPPMPAQKPKTALQDEDPDKAAARAAAAAGNYEVPIQPASTSAQSPPAQHAIAQNGQELPPEVARLLQEGNQALANNRCDIARNKLVELARYTPVRSAVLKFREDYSRCVAEAKSGRPSVPTPETAQLGEDLEAVRKASTSSDQAEVRRRQKFQADLEVARNTINKAQAAEMESTPILSAWPTGPACDRIDADFRAAQFASQKGNFAEAARLKGKAHDEALKIGRPPSEVPGDEVVKAAWEADRGGDYVKAVRLFKEIDAAGDTAIAGLPRGETPHFSCGWYHRGTAAIAGIVQGNLAGAREAIGEHFEKGLGVPQSYSTAISWYERARDQSVGDHPSGRAAVRLAYLYANGNGVPKDLQKAGELFKSIGPSSEIILAAMNYGLLPKSPEDWTPAIAEAAAKKTNSANMARLSPLIMMLMTGGPENRNPQDTSSCRFWSGASPSPGPFESPFSRGNILCP